MVQARRTKRQLRVYPAYSYRSTNPATADENQVWTFNWIKVVPVETDTTISVAERFAKMPKKAPRELLGLVCDKMIERRGARYQDSLRQ